MSPGDVVPAVAAPEEDVSTGYYQHIHSHEEISDSEIRYEHAVTFSESCLVEHNPVSQHRHVAKEGREAQDPHGHSQSQVPHQVGAGGELVGWGQALVRGDGGRPGAAEHVGVGREVAQGGQAREDVPCEGADGVVSYVQSLQIHQTLKCAIFYLGDSVPFKGQGDRPTEAFKCSRLQDIYSEARQIYFHNIPQT